MTASANKPMKDRCNYPLLLASQFLSAFGDNLILMLILGPFLTQFKAGTITAEAQSVANIYYTSLLFVPYVLLAPLAGYLNDRFSKNRWLLGGNFIKLAGTGMVWLGLVSGSAWQAIGYFTVGIGACVYSPAKYGILPEILPAARLVKANGLMELLTLVAILTGNIAGSSAFDKYPLRFCYLMVIAVYGLSLVLNLFMSRTPNYREVRLQGSIGKFFSNLADLFSQKRLARILVGTALFWICGAILKMNFQPWGQQILQLTTMLQISLLGLWLSVGVMIGSVLAGQLYAVGDLHATRRYGWLLAAGIAVLGCIGWLLVHGLNYPNIRSPKYSTSEIKDLPQLVNKLTHQSDPLSAYLWQSLSNQEQALLLNYKPSAPDSKQAQHVVVQFLNKTIGDPSIYETNRFQDVSLRPQTIGLMKRSPTGLSLTHLNRLLLEDAYPKELARIPNILAPSVLILTGLIAGLFLIPLNAALQAESHKDKLGKTIATQNGFENLAMLGGSLLAYIDVKVGFNPSELFLALALFAAIVVIWLKIPGKIASENAIVE